MATLVSDWLKHFRLLLWNRWTEFNEHDRKQDLNQVCVFRDVRKKDGCTGLWLPETFSTSLKLNGFQWKLIGSKTSTSSTRFVFFGPIRKTRWQPRPKIGLDIFEPIGNPRLPSLSLIGWDIFEFFSATAEQNSTKFDREQDLNILYRVCFCGSIWKPRWLPWPICQQRRHNVLRCTICDPLGPMFVFYSFGHQYKNIDMAMVVSFFTLYDIHTKILIWQWLFRLLLFMTYIKRY